MSQLTSPSDSHQDRPVAPRRVIGSRRRRAVLGLAGAVTLTVAATGAIAAPAAAQVVSGEACSPGEGVTVVVDFTSIGDSVQIGCAPGEQATGFAALAAAGFSVGSEAGPGSVCTINGAPTEGYPYCWATGGYWSYWKKSVGGSWGFSGSGPNGGPLAIDTVEGWSWAQGFSSAAPRADETTVPPTTTTTTTSTTTTTTTTSTTLAPAPSTTAAPGSTTSTVGTDPTGPTTVPGPPTSAPPGSSTPGGATGPVGAGRPPASVAGAAQRPAAPPRAPLARTGDPIEVTALVGATLLALGAVTAGSARRLQRARS